MLVGKWVARTDKLLVAMMALKSVDSMVALMVALRDFAMVALKVATLVAAWAF